ncbi:ferrochelatase [Sanguibacter sp. HDW7]|uniref:ferrochelatase n=1 Tax=Sanguibacter sp. HDW7 TaxID=2714931 RepID=UPI00140B179F|nr:ferrochelatase [Sanguibacter sp. HDW7]QIK83495.1 ferrochelatase [Sanguibacter sp. HDW7]
MSRVAVVLLNLGTPEAPTPRAVRRYLREFLSDRRVVETHPALWRPILEAVVLTVRPRASAAKYASVWTADGSPLLVHSRAQRDGVAAALASGDIDVRVAMTYGSPSLSSVLDDLSADGLQRVLVVPLYPQYSGSSAGAALDALRRHGLRRRDTPEIRTVRSFPEDEGYIDALARAVEASWVERGRPDVAAGDRLLLSYHSVPVAMIEAGDPYAEECARTTAALTQRLGLPREGVVETFQSVFGPAQWHGPATIDTVAALARSGTRRLDVVCPGFVSDCLETLEEIDMLNREAFVEAGGVDFSYVPWGNSNQPWVDALAAIVRQHLGGWPVGACTPEEPVKNSSPLEVR